MNEQNKFLSEKPQYSFPFNENQKEIADHKTEDLPCVCYTRNYYNDWYPYHWHEEFEFTLVRRGSIIISINGQDCLIQEGEAIFINSSTLHSFISPENVESTFLNLLFHPSLIYGSTDSIFYRKYLQPLMSSSNLSHILLIGNSSWEKKILQLISQVIDTLNYKEWCYEFQVRDMISEMMYLLCMHHSDKIISPIFHNTLEHARIRTMLSFIHNHYSEPIQLQDISDAASISRRECLRCFNKLLKISPMQYVMDFRIREAKKLLSDPTYAILDICLNCGFQDQSYFTKVFREHTGMTPGKYRKQISSSYRPL